MNKKVLLLAVCGVIICGFFLRACFSGPEAEIRQQLSKLEELVSYEAGEGNLTALTKARQLGRLFAEEVDIELRGFGQSRRVGSREQVQQAAMAARSQVGSLKASLHDIAIEISEDKRAAVVEATGRAQAGDDSRSMVQAFRFTFEKTPDGWLIAKVRTLEALR